MASANAARHALARKREIDALNLRLAGATYEQIAAQLGLRGPSSAREVYTRGLDRLAPIADRERARALEAARLDRLMIAHWQKAIGGDRDATQTVLSIMARRARLLGLDAPVDLNVNALMKLIAEMRSLPEADLLEALGYESEQPALPEHIEDPDL